MADPFYNLDPDFSRRLQAMISASGGRLSIGSGFRTRAEQQRLYDRYKAGVPGQARAAAPGHSKHEFGLAVDLTGDLDWAHEHAQEFGIYFPMDDEPWHAQPLDGDTTFKADYKSGLQSAGINPDDEIASRLNSIQRILVGGAPSADTAHSLSPQQDRLINSFFMADRNTPYPQLKARTDITSLTGDKGKLQQYALSRFRQFGWDQSELDALIELWNRESGWNPAADNPTSSAAGIAQKMQSVHGPVESSPQAQIDWGLNYIAQRYGSPSAALAFHNNRNFY